MIVMHRLHRLWPLVVALAAVAARSAGAQVGATTDIITGTVTGPDSQPLAGAIVVAPAQVTVARQADEDRIEATIRMGLFAVPLEPVTVSARSSARSEGAGPGSTGRSYNADQLARLPISAFDLSTVATLQPGVLGIRETDSTVTAFSVAGQRPTANSVTLDGLSFGSGSVPQDAVRSIRVITNAYDVARGQYSGGIVATTTRSGTNVPQGAFTYALRDREVAWGEVTGSPFGQGATQNLVSGGLGGPIVPDRLFVFGALQGRWRAQALPSLATADPGPLARLGVSPDSTERFVALAAAAGLPVAAPGRYDDRATSSTLGLLRLDWQASDVHTLARWQLGAPAADARRPPRPACDRGKPLDLGRPRLRLAHLFRAWAPHQL